MKKILCKILWHKFVVQITRTPYGNSYDMYCEHCGYTLEGGFEPRDVVERLVKKYQHRKRII